MTKQILTNLGVMAAPSYLHVASLAGVACLWLSDGVRLDVVRKPHLHLRRCKSESYTYIYVYDSVSGYYVTAAAMPSSLFSGGEQAKHVTWDDIAARLHRSTANDLYTYARSVAQRALNNIGQQ